MDYASPFERLGLRARSTQGGQKLFNKQFFVSRRSDAAAVLLVAAAYYAGSRVGFRLTPQQTPIALFWPPNAMLLAAFLLMPIRVWWICLLAVLPAHMLVQSQVGIPMTTALGWYIGNTSEALIGAATIIYLSKIGRTHFSLDGTKGLKIFLIGAVFTAPFLTSFVDAASVAWSGYARGYWTLWATRLVSNMIANLTLVPAIVTLCRDGRLWFSKTTLTRWLEFASVSIGVAVASLYVFSMPSGAVTNISAAIFAPLPFLLWAALRFGIGGVSSTLLIVALISLGSAVRGLQTSEPAAIARNVLTLQVLIAAFGLSLMWVPALISERRRMERSIANRREFLIQAEQALRQVGRKLHGDLTQQLTLLGLDVERLSSKIEPSIVVKTQLVALNEQITQLSTTTRDWSHVLDPVSIEYLGLAGALAALCRHASEKSTVKFEFSGEIGRRRLDSITSLCLYRVVQEAIENIVKLSSARIANVMLELRDKSALLVIEDDGAMTSSEPQPETGIGVMSVRERVALLNGTFSVQSSPAGTRIEVSVPLPKIERVG